MGPSYGEGRAAYISVLTYTLCHPVHARKAVSKGRALDTSRNSRMPLGEDASKVSRCVLFSTNSAMNFSAAVVTSGQSAQASRQHSSVGMCAGYSQSNNSPAGGAVLRQPCKRLVHPQQGRGHTCLAQLQLQIQDRVRKSLQIPYQDAQRLSVHSLDAASSSTSMVIRRDARLRAPHRAVKRRRSMP